MLLVSNWKAYVENMKKAEELVALAKTLSNKGHEIVLAPSNPHLGLLLKSNRSKVRFASQDFGDTMSGAHTGEVTAATIAGVGVTYSILGHSERRTAGESDEIISSKVRRALAHGLRPIVCIGERERDSEARYLIFLRTQIKKVMEGLSQKEQMQIIWAYEPIWAIGKTADEATTPDDLLEMILYIRKVLGEFLPGRSSEKVTILYGGSVESLNAKELASGTGIDGFLIGHSSVDVEAFSGIVKAVT